MAAKKSAAPKRDSFSAEDIDEIVSGIRKVAGEDKAVLASGGGLDIKIRGVISTRCAPLDDAIGRGGIPLGRFTILHGPEASGKTTLACQLVAECQAMGGVCVYMDCEYKLDVDYAASLGVDMKRLILSQPSYLEQAFAIQEEAIKKASLFRERYGRRVPILVVLDSMNAAITKAQFEGEWDDQHMAPQARVYSSLLPKLIPMAAREDVALLYISQVRKKMNVQYGSDEEIAGGKAPPFYASLIINVRRIGSIKDGEVSVGNRTQAECRKNQIAPPFRKALFVIAYGKGVDNERAIIELAAEKDILEKKGSHYSFGARKLGQGLGPAAELLRKDPELLEQIKRALRDGGALSVAGDPNGGDAGEEEQPKERSKWKPHKSKINMDKMREGR